MVDQVATAVIAGTFTQLQYTRMTSCAGLGALASLHQQREFGAYTTRNYIGPSFGTLEVLIAEVAGEQRPALFAALTGLP